MRIDPSEHPHAMVVDAAGRLERVGPYRVLEKLGRGGMGVVYRVAGDDAPSTPLALKTIEAHFFSQTRSNARQRFLQEIRVLAPLEHPSIARFRDAGVAKDDFGSEALFLVTDFVDGESLRSKIKSEGRISRSQALRHASDVADALRYLDNSGVVHRDLTPNNVLIERSRDRAVLIDFGLARSEEFTRLTESGMIIGSLRYMAPERLRSGEGDIRSDVFSLGAVLFEMLAGKPAFDVADNRFSELMHKIVEGLPWTEELRRSIGDPLADLLDEMVDSEAELRPSPAVLKERFAALQRAPTATLERSEPPKEANDVRIAAPPASRIEAARESAIIAPKEEPPPRGISPWVAVAIGIVTLGGGLAGGWVGAQAVDPPSSPVVATRLPPPAPPARVFRAEPPPEPPREAPPPAFPRFTSDESAFAFGRFSELEGDAVAARRAYQRAIELNPVMAEAHRNLGELLKRENDIDGAVRHLRIYVGLKPSAPDADKLRAWLDSLPR